MNFPNLRHTLKKQVDDADDHLLLLIQAFIKAYKKHTPAQKTESPKKPGGLKKQLAKKAVSQAQKGKNKLANPDR